MLAYVSLSRPPAGLPGNLADISTTPPVRQNLFQLCNMAEVYGLVLDQANQTPTDIHYTHISHIEYYTYQIITHTYIYNDCDYASIYKRRTNAYRSYKVLSSWLDFLLPAGGVEHLQPAFLVGDAQP